MDKLIRSFARWLGGYSTLVFFAILALLFLGATLIIVITVLRSIAPLHLYELLDQFLKETPKYFSVVIGVAILAIVSTIFRNVIVGLQRESKDYARKISRRDGATSISASIGPLTVTGKTDNSRLRRTIKELREEIASLKDAPAPVDISAPEKLFQVARQRLLDEAVRIDSISRRNLIIGILFSIIALGVLAWPLIAAVFQSVDTTGHFDVFVWAAQYYLPRFAVGLLLQFVGFFFLRLYVANELDLKHNKNEITNIEMKMMGVQLAQSFGDATSKKEIMKSLAMTERNFLIKKNEKTTSTEALSEYNDMRGLFEKLIDKLPRTGK